MYHITQQQYYIVIILTSQVKVTQVQMQIILCDWELSWRSLLLFTCNIIFLGNLPPPPPAPITFFLLTWLCKFTFLANVFYVGTKNAFLRQVYIFLISSSLLQLCMHIKMNTFKKISHLVLCLPASWPVCRVVSSFSLTLTSSESDTHITSHHLLILHLLRFK